MAGIYIHIPLCKVRCAYCDFYSSVEFSSQELLVAALCKELIQEKSYIENEAIETIYFGGGTPSLLSLADFQKIFETISQHYDISGCKEITLEANPDDLSKAYILQLRSLPFNRISIGIQSLLDKELKLINRRHSAQEAIDAVKRCKALGFENISIDLIYGYPSQTVADFKYSLAKVLEMNIQHVSAYHLTYEEGTVLYQKLQKKEIIPVDEDTSVEMYNLLVSTLNTNGIMQYEISNFACPGYESKHNSSYWDAKKYLGIGPSAHSYNASTRRWNISSMADYIKGINKNTSVSETEQLTENDKYNDFVMTSLRTLKGLSLDKLKSEFGTKYYYYCFENADKYLKNNDLIIAENYLRFTEKGFVVSDCTISDMLSVD